MGHGDNAVTEQDVTNPARDRAKYGDTSETMKALAWMGKNDVQVGQYIPFSYSGTLVHKYNLYSRDSQAQNHRGP